MRLEFRDSQALYDNDIQELLAITDSPMDDAAFAAAAEAVLNRHVTVLMNIRSSIAEDVELGNIHAAMAGEALLRGQEYKAALLDRIRRVALESAFQSITPEEIIGNQ